MTKKYALLLGGVLMVASCATLFTSKIQKLSFDSNESNVDVYVDAKKVCTTPCIAPVERSNDTVLIVGRKAGFEDSVVTLNPTINLVTLINIFSTTGFTTDASLGYIWEYRPNAFYITMEKEPKTEAERKQREKEKEIRRYILSNYSNLLSDTSHNGVKEYIDGLSQMTGLVNARIIDELARTHDEITFTNRIISLYRAKQK